MLRKKKRITQNKGQGNNHICFKINLDFSFYLILFSDHKPHPNSSTVISLCCLIRNSIIALISWLLPGCISRQHCWPATLLSCKQHRQDWQGSSSQLPAELLLSWEDGAGWSGDWAWAASWLCQEVPAECQACVGNEFRSQRRPFCGSVHRRHCKGEFMVFFALAIWDHSWK